MSDNKKLIETIDFILGLGTAFAYKPTEESKKRLTEIKGILVAYDAIVDEYLRNRTRN